MDKEKRPYVCPTKFAGSLDNSIRKLVHKPRRILEAHIKKGMTVLDLGCGPGYFTIELAKLAGEEGWVIAADLQQGITTSNLGKPDFEKALEQHSAFHLKSGLAYFGKGNFISAEGFSKMACN